MKQVQIQQNINLNRFQCIEFYIINEPYVATKYTSILIHWYLAKIDNMQKEVQFYW
jgi:hypothetical protein